MHDYYILCMKGETFYNKQIVRCNYENQIYRELMYYNHSDGRLLQGTTQLKKLLIKTKINV